MSVQRREKEPAWCSALVRAEEVRFGRLKIKREVRSGKMSVVEAATHEYCAKMTVFDLLRAQYMWGRARALRVLDELCMSEVLTCGSLTERQRASLARVLGYGEKM